MAKVKIKFVKKANMWCRTTITDGTQKQEWFSEKPNAKAQE